MHFAFTPSDAACLNLLLLTQSEWQDGHADISAAAKAFAGASGFKATSGQSVFVQNGDGDMQVLAGIGDGDDVTALISIAASLPGHNYKITHAPNDWTLPIMAAAWADGVYRFDRYKAGAGATAPRLFVPENVEGEPCWWEADAVSLLRDLVNTPASDMGPEHLQGVVEALGEEFDARVKTIAGEDLLGANYPMIHAVGREGSQAPRYIELDWGSSRTDAPLLALVGKGVCYDTGGLNLKPGDSMRHMKKDMGGAAHVIALARLVMQADLPVRLVLAIPAVENNVGPNSMRPGDIIPTRKGISVEIDNTDAEGRLVLSDALACVSEREPDLLIDFATLTGAARVALGPDLAPFYTNDDDLSAAMIEAGERSNDPVWPMPLWGSYRRYLNSSVADIQNAGGRMGGSITAALFLKEFVTCEHWMHLDVWAWREARFGRPAGAAACGLRAVWDMLGVMFTED